MTGSTTGTVRWLLLCALAVGVIGMHHLGLTGHHGHDGPMVDAVVAMATGADTHERPAADAVDSLTAAGCCVPAPRPANHHGVELLLHLCLAMLASAALLCALLVRWRGVGRDIGPPHPTSWVPQRWVPPDSGTALASLGVLRL